MLVREQPWRANAWRRWQELRSRRSRRRSRPVRRGAPRASSRAKPVVPRAGRARRAPSPILAQRAASDGCLVLARGAPRAQRRALRGSLVRVREPRQNLQATWTRATRATSQSTRDAAAYRREGYVRFVAAPRRLLQRGGRARLAAPRAARVARRGVARSRARARPQRRPIG